jgi:hypothetical protein
MREDIRCTILAPYASRHANAVLCRNGSRTGGHRTAPGLGSRVGRGSHRVEWRVAEGDRDNRLGLADLAGIVTAAARNRTGPPYLLPGRPYRRDFHRFQESDAATIRRGTRNGSAPRSADRIFIASVAPGIGCCCVTKGRRGKSSIGISPSSGVFVERTADTASGSRR